MKNNKKTNNDAYAIMANAHAGINGIALKKDALKYGLQTMAETARPLLEKLTVGPLGKLPYNVLRILESAGATINMAGPTRAPILKQDMSGLTLG